MSRATLHAEDSYDEFDNENTVVGLVAAAQIYENGKVNRVWVDGSDADEEEHEEHHHHVDSQQLSDVAGDLECPCCGGGGAGGSDELTCGVEEDDACCGTGGDGCCGNGAGESECGCAANDSACALVAQASSEDGEDEANSTVLAVAVPADAPAAPPRLAAAFQEQGGLPVAPRYYDWRTVFPELQLLLDNFEVIHAEMVALTATRWTPWPEVKLYQAVDQNGVWKVIPLMHTFPAWDADKSRFIESNCEQCPRTMALLQQLPGLRTVLFSRLGPKTRLSKHQGWADLANYVLRCHLPLTMPDEKTFPDSAGMWVEGEVRFHKQRDFVVFDDSKFHKAFNASDFDRIVLIFDLMRPDSIPKGLATGGHTEQLDQFIDQYNREMGLAGH
jgi:aspartyl/asparaginyl beta-hydroxylase (cupin superfamily)